MRMMEKVSGDPVSDTVDNPAKPPESMFFLKMMRLNRTIMEFSVDFRVLLL